MFKSKGFWITIGILAVIIGIIWSQVNTCIEYEVRIKKARTSVDNVLANKVVNTIQGMGLAADKYKDGVIEAIKAKYGQEGSQATFQWFQEQFPGLPQDTYLKLQQAIEIGYNAMEAEQKSQIDIVGEYDIFINQPGRFPARLLGYPKIDMENAWQIITNKQTKQARETGDFDGSQLLK